MGKTIVKNEKIASLGEIAGESPFWTSPYLRPGIIVLIVVMGLVAYCNCFSCPFVLDDPDQIQNNAGIRQVWPIWFPITYGGQLTRPLVYVTLAINYAISELKVWSYHIFNLAVHLAAAMTLFGLVRRTLLLPSLRQRFERHATVLAGIISMIWLVHPMLTSAVTYVIQRAESMMGLAYFLTLYLSVRAIEDRDSNKSIKWIVLAALACAAGMGCKQIMVTAPLMVIAFDWTFMDASRRERWRLAIYFVLVGLIAGLVIGKSIIIAAVKDKFGANIPDALVYSAAAIPVLWMLVDLSAKTLSGGFKRRICLYASLPVSYVVLALSMSATPMGDTAGFGMEKLTAWQYFLTEIGVHITYLKLAIVPYPLCLDYELPTVTSLGQVWLPALMVLAALLGATLWGLIRKRELGFLGLWWFLILAPSSSFMPIKDKIFEFRVYVSMAGLVCLIVLVAYRLGGKVLSRLDPQSPKLGVLRQHVTAAALALCLTFLLSTVWAVLFVMEKVRWMTYTVFLLPACAGAFYGLALLAFRDVRASVSGIGRTAGLGAGLALILGFTTMTIMRNYDYRTDLALWKQTLEIRPDNPRAHSNMGVVLLLSGRPIDEGMWHLRKSVEVSNGTFCDAIYNIGVMMGKTGQPSASLDWYKKCLAVDPKYVNARQNLAVALNEIGRPDDALAEYAIILKQEPKHVGALTNAGLILFERKLYSEAIEYLKRAVEEDMTNVGAWTKLAEAYRNLGRDQEAAYCQKQVDQLTRRGAGMQYTPAYKN